jgi:NAD(P)-dependent dehydrogenase (short-subunit alcohol dehydrogenase family)
MTGPIALVTGSTDGIGKATARDLVAGGAEVILHGRDREKGTRVAREIEKETGKRGLSLIIADLSRQNNVVRLAEEVYSRYDRLDVLINNAGTFEQTRRMTSDGVEMTFAVNYLAPFLLTRHILPLLKKSIQSRVVNVASIAHRDVRTIDWENLLGEKSYDPFDAYSLSKFAVITFTYTLARQIAATDITVNCLHPGVVETKMLREGFPGVRGKPPSEGAKTSVFLALSPEVEGLTGMYFEESRRPVRSSSLTYDREIQERLWKIADELTGLREKDK